jgi:hypothetical protein
MGGWSEGILVLDKSFSLGLAFVGKDQLEDFSLSEVQRGHGPSVVSDSFTLQ